MTFIEQIITEYPVPIEYSIWGEDMENDRNPVASLKMLVQACIRELESDLYVVERKRATTYSLTLPPDTIAVSSAKLEHSFPGNRLVKANFDFITKQVTIRYYPATITYRRKVRVEDLEGLLCGDRLIYFKNYLLWKMAQKEIQVIGSIKLDADNASIDLSALQNYVSERYAQYKQSKEDITLYAGVN